MKIACDDGSTYVKLAWRQDGEIKTHVVGNSFREGWKTELFGSEPVCNFLVDGRKYTHDVASTSTLSTTHINYQYSDLNLLAVHYALLTSGIDPQSVELIVTLPVTEFFDADAQINETNIDKKRKNLLRSLDLNKGETFSISKIEVMPESLPAILPVLSTEQVNSYEKSLVLDLGGTTLDCAVIVGAFESVSEIKGFPEIGTNQVTNAIVNALTIASTQCSYFVADQVSRNANDSEFLLRIVNDSSQVDRIKITISQETKNLAERVCRVIESFNGIHRIYLTGGGGELIFNEIKKRYPVRKVIKLDQAQLALVKAMIAGE